MLASLGMMPAVVLQRVPSPPAYTAVSLDGVTIGHIQAGLASGAVARLRELKVLNLAISEQGQPPAGLLPPQASLGSMFVHASDSRTQPGVLRAYPAGQE